MTTPDPDPATTPGLAPGGGVDPGDTPPGESSTSGLSSPEAPPGRVLTPLAIAFIALLVLAVVGFFIAQIIAW